MTVKLLTKHHLRFLSLKGGCIGSSESTLVKMPRCWTFAAQIDYTINIFLTHSGGNNLYNDPTSSNCLYPSVMSFPNKLKTLKILKYFTCMKRCAKRKLLVTLFQVLCHRKGIESRVFVYDATNVFFYKTPGPILKYFTHMSTSI